VGTYFSEELKAVIKLGYTVKMIKGIHFTRFKPFTEYVNHFYETKKNSIGPLRFITKSHLNNFYGIFGIKNNKLETLMIDSRDLP
jgi:hypothetical protein